jgi:peptide deformylase
MIIKPNLLKLKGIYTKSVRNVSITDFRTQSFRNWYRSLWNPVKNQPPYSHIVQIGDPVLRLKSDLVPIELITSKEIDYLIQRMLAVQKSYKCVGLAAPQIGIPLRIILLEFTDRLKDVFTKEVYAAKEMSTLPLTVIINPEIKIINYDTMVFEESCESVRGYAAEVPRYKEVMLSGYNRKGKASELVLKGWNARIAQHEMDHLDGVSYTDKMDRKTLCCTSWQAVNSRSGRITIPFSPK